LFSFGDLGVDSIDSFGLGFEVGFELIDLA
jgi:hypothetical protein